MPCQSMLKRPALKIAISRFHDCPESTKFVIKNHIIYCIPIGVVLKYVKIASGDIDKYPGMFGASE